MLDFTRLKKEIKEWAQTLCHFHDLKVGQVSPLKDMALIDWLNLNCHGEMQYMAKDPHNRLDPKHLLPDAKSVVLVTLPYSFFEQNHIDKPKIATYSLGRDYHKIMRSRLKKLIRIITEHIGVFQSRIFVDSAPILEKSFAKRAGIGWMGKNTLLIQKGCGSFFVIGGFCCDLPLPPDEEIGLNQCGTCEQCLHACPTGALSRPYHLNARLCIAYLTMEYKGSIPVELRSKMGRHIFGCDECQKACPWNKKRTIRIVDDFHPRDIWLTHDLVTLFKWTEDEFLKHTEGSSIRRLGHECFLRNIAIALGNSPYSEKRLTALKSRLNDPSALVCEHVSWAINKINIENFD
jgi:epoxyqueuosine reductase